MRSSRALLEELATLEHRLKRATDEHTLRLVHTQLIRIRNTTRSTSEDVRARYFFLRGMVYAKAARTNQSGFLGSASECLQHALELMIDADLAIKQAASDDGWTRELEVLRQRCAYEAVSIVTVLKVWGDSPSILPDTSSLDASTQRKAKNALRHHYMLPSRF